MEKRAYKILAVDDEKLNLVILQSCLKGENYEITSTTDTAEALAAFKSINFDVILLDVMMGGIDGFELRKLIREYNAKIPIIFLTSLLDDIDSTLISKIASDQSSYYLNKSFKKDVIIEKIEQAIRVYREENEMSLFYKQVETDITLASEVQRIMLPPWCKVTDKMIHTYYYEPKFKVSGDLVEFFELENDKFLFCLGDISGHGIQAALYMTAIQTFIKSVVLEYKHEELEVHEILNRINSFFMDELRSDNYMTCLITIIDYKEKKLISQSAGHPHLICCSPSKGTAELVDYHGKGGIPIGWQSTYKYQESENIVLDINDDDIFVGYTDGLTDLTNQNNESVGIELLLGLLGTIATDTGIFGMPYKLKNALSQIGYNQDNDDTTIVALQRRERKDSDLILMLSQSVTDVSKSVKLVADFVMDKIDSIATATRVELLLSEFLNNVVIHNVAGKYSSKSMIAIKIIIDDHHVYISVLDRSEQWSQEEKMALSMEASEIFDKLNEERATSGRGLAIIRSIAKQIHRRYYDGLNETKFIVEI